jgi:hypothetical protein
VHVSVADRDAQGKSGLLERLGPLPLSGVEGEWWMREG